MQKIAVIGLEKQKESIMSKLMDFGAIELVSQKSKLSDKDLGSIVTLDDSHAKAAALDAKLSMAEAALNFLKKYDPAKEPLFTTRRVMKADAARNIDREKAEEDISSVLKLEEHLKDVNDRKNKLEQEEILITPWLEYAMPLEMIKTPKTIIHEGIVPATVDRQELMNDLEVFGGIVAKLVHSDKDMNYIAFICLISQEQQILALLKQKGFSEVYFRGLKGTAKENLKRIKKEKEVLDEEIREIEQEASRMAMLRQSIENYRDMTAIDSEKEKIKNKLLRTKKTFYLEGWIPERLTEKAGKLLEGMNCCYEFADAEEGEEVPVLLDNKNFFVPYEAITEMYSLPDYRGFDPTSIFALFYAVFFGIMLSDAGYGIIMAVGCFTVLRKFNLEGNTYKMVKLFFYCGISTTIWGALFGGWFGDIVAVFTRTFLGTEIAIAPIWFNPLDDPMKMLIFSLILGIIHLFTGMAIKAYMQIKEGHWFDAVCDEGLWYITIIGFIAWLGGGMVLPAAAAVGKWMTIIGAAGLLLTGGRHNKGFGKVTGGLSNIYNITSYMSDILSYARLLALGLATGVIAQVVNTLGSLFGGGIGGLIALVIIFLLGHTLNLAINVLGAFIHSSRLQYVEFFGKFYEDGGEPFDPFRKKTKYIKIEQEEE
ncbi:MAG: V-type ATP synthase subunit I [Firmicutes bacterium]|nr:V-type ATP synthase subunit I [Bacillota bacterium]